MKPGPRGDWDPSKKSHAVAAAEEAIDNDNAKNENDMTSSDGG